MAEIVRALDYFYLEPGGATGSTSVGSSCQNLHFIAIGIGEEQVRLTRAELASLQHASSRLLHRAHRRIDVGGINEPKSEMRHTARLACAQTGFLEDEHIAASGRLSLDESGVSIHCNDAKHLLIEAQQRVPPVLLALDDPDEDMAVCVNTSHAYWHTHTNVHTLLTRMCR